MLLGKLLRLSGSQFPQLQCEGINGSLQGCMATHSSVLAWRIPGTGEPGGLPSTGSHRVGHNWSNLVQQQHKAAVRFNRYSG